MTTPCISRTAAAIGAALLLAASFPAHGQAAQDTTTKFAFYQGVMYNTTSPLNEVTTFTYDKLNRLQSVNQSGIIVGQYERDGLDQMTKVTDARGKITSYSIDGLGNLLSTTSGDTGVTSSLYDDAGNLTSRTDAKLQTTTFKYDALDRLILSTFSDSATVAYQYDQGDNAIGQLSRITDASGTIEYAYDGFGRLASERRSIGGQVYTTSYRFDDAGKLSGMSYPGGRSVDYRRDTLGRITEITTSAGGAVTVLVSQVEYQPFGPVKSVTFGNGSTQVRAYDVDGRMASFSLAEQTMGITYDAASRIKAIGAHTYGYDKFDRLTSAITPTSGQTFDYDAVGNRVFRAVNAATTTLTYGGGGNRLTQVGAQPIATDANGSITNKGNATFNYDARGRMVSANTQIGLVQYLINSLGQRVRKTTPTETTVFHYDAGGKLIAEATTTGSVVKTQEYVYLGDMPVAVMK